MLAAFANDADTLAARAAADLLSVSAVHAGVPDDGNSLFASLDSLATLEGGGTPLYDSLEEMVGDRGRRDHGRPNLRQAAVLFSDGKDIYCAEPPGSFQFCTQQARRGRDRGRERDVDIFTIGLSDECRFAGDGGAGAAQWRRVSCLPSARPS